MLSRKRKENLRLRVKMESNPSENDEDSCNTDDQHSISSKKDAEDHTIETDKTSTHKTKLTLEEKTRLLDDLASNKKSIKDILRKYKMSRSSLNSILNNRNGVKGSSSKTINKNVSPLFKILEKRILDWVRNANEKKKSFNAKVLQKKARENAEDLGIADFKRSSTWVERLKARNKEVVYDKFKEGRKVFTLTLERKAELIADVDKGDRSKRDLAEEYGIAPSTLSGIMVNRIRILEAFHSQAFRPERKKFRKSSFEDLEKELLLCVLKWQSANEPFNGPKLMEKAKEIAKDLEITEFVGSNGWIDRFKNRNNIKFIPGCEVNKGYKEDRKITTLTLERKVELLEEVEKGERSKRQIAEEFGIAPSTLSGIIVNRVRIMEAHNSKCFGPGRKKFRRSTFQDVEEDLLKWVEETKKQNSAIKSTQLLDKAKEIAKEKGIENFAGSHSWVDRFKSRNLKTFNSSVDDDNTEQDSNQSENQSDQDSEPATPDAGDSSDVSQMTKEAYDAIEQRPEFQNIFKKHKCRDQYRKYTQEQLMEACKYSMETKASYREVSEKFGIPQSTLRDKLHAVEKLNTDVGQPPIKKARTESTETKTSTESSTMVLSPEIPDNNSDSDKLNAASNDRSNYRQYSKDSLTTAAHYVMKFNTPIMKAARMFGVPASTLKDHVRNKLPQDTEQLTQPSTPSLINDRDERKLIEYIKMMEKCGFILTTKEIIEFGSELASASQEIEGSITLSDSWYLDFVKRWPPLGMVNREGRSPIPQDIKKYFMELNKIFNKHKFFERPELVYVMDEVDITLEYNPLKLVPRKRFSRSNQCKTTQQKLTSVVGCSNGLGTTLPPYYVLQSDEIVTDVISQSPPGTQAMFANTVRKDCSTLRDYFQNHFMRFAQSGRNTQNRFVLVFYDSRRTNLNVSDIDWAKRWHILLFPLPHPIKKEEESAREILNGIFQNYGDDVEEERSKFVKQKGYMAVSMPDICGILGKAYRKSLTYAHISSCFESYGIYPLNPRNYVSRLDASFQLKLHDLQAMPNYETNLWLLSDFSCTQAVNNAIESSFNSSEGNNLYCRGENNARYVKHNNSGTESSNCNANNQTSSGYSQDSAAFNTSYQGLINHLMVQAVRDNSQIEPQILNGVAIKTEPQMDFGYGQVTVTPQIQESYSQQQYILESSISSASNESQNTQNCQVVPQMYLYQNGSESCNSLNNGTTENQDTNTASASNDDLTNNSQVVMQAKSKCESSSSSRRKGKSYRVIVNEPEPENETTDKQLSDDIAENPPPESNKIFSKSKLDTCRKTSRLGSLLDEKVRKLHEQAKASSEVVEDLDEPLMKIGEFQIVMNKGE
ncbi:uncharacterized protein LOC127734578 isoform X1 [Mytilus californianus]|uniref:uncharacterized protein LOC127734578 isoform X1 n=1 Tax=Mytilus californianus TaxID=6549 RepID=UPI0022457F67|nr:uncharacterized protein LOC127734578 isoform X1 [Mytilus californianus]